MEVAQRIEHQPSDREVVGLNPTGCLSFFKYIFLSLSLYLHQSCFLKKVLLVGTEVLIFPEYKNEGLAFQLETIQAE